MPMRTTPQGDLLERLLDSQPAQADRSPAVATLEAAPAFAQPASADVPIRPALSRSGITAAPRAEPSKPSRRAQPGAGALGELYTKLGKSIGLLGFVALASFLWYVGAVFTLDFLRTLSSLQRLGPAQWLIPLGISCTELFLLKLRSWPPRIALAAVLLFDVGTTVSGLIPVVRGQTIDIFMPLTIPQAGGWLYGGALLAGLFLAYFPEKLLRASLRELGMVWR